MNGLIAGYKNKYFRFSKLVLESSVNCLACGAFERNFGPLGEAKNPPTICNVA